MSAPEAKVEVLAVSGMVRVTVQPQASILILLLEALGILIFWGVTIQRWTRFSLLMRAIFVWADISAVIGLFYQLSGSEEIEFDAEKLTIKKSIVVWESKREYPVESCSELEWRASSRENRGCALQCKVGWRTIRFAEYTSENQATEILIALQQHLPDVFRKMGAMPGLGKSHFTTLDLS